MAINRTIDFLPEYLQTISNQRFLNSTLDRLVSDPVLRPFDGFVGRREVAGNQLSGAYVTEPTQLRERYQLEPEFVFKQGNTTTQSAGFLDVINSVAARGAVAQHWNRLLTADSWAYRGFVDLDKLVNYQNYLWIPDVREVAGSQVDENPWYRTAVEISNSTVPSQAEFAVQRTATGFTVQGQPGQNPIVYLARGGSYVFNISASTAEPATREPRVVQQLVGDALQPREQLLSVFGQSVVGFRPTQSLSVTPVDQFNFRQEPFCVETWVWFDSDYAAADAQLVGQWDSTQLLDSSWALMRTGEVNSVKFQWRDPESGEIQVLQHAGAGISTGTWHHLAVSRRGAEIRLYVDGVRTGTASISGSIIRTDIAITVGADAAAQLPFAGALSDLRISTGTARYTTLQFAVPDSQLQNDAFTQLLLPFAGSGASLLADLVQPFNSRVWIQTHPGVQGNNPFNPNLLAREVLGVINNGTVSGRIDFQVPSLADESYFRNLKIQGVAALDQVDLATTLNFDQINAQVLSTFVQTPRPAEDSDQTGRRGGIDGVTSLDGKTVIFVGGQEAGWVRTRPYESLGVDQARYEATGPVPADQWFGIWQIRVVQGILELVPVGSIPADHRVTVKNGSVFRNTQWYKTTDTSVLQRLPALSSDYTSLYLQDDQRLANQLEIRVINTEATQLDVDQDIVGKPYYTSSTGVQLLDGMRIRFAPDAVPAQYTQAVRVGRTRLSQQTNSAAILWSLPDTQLVQPGDLLQLSTELALVVAVHDSQVEVVRGFRNTVAQAAAADTWISILRTPEFIVEGVGEAIVLVPAEQLVPAEPYLDRAQDADYVTINRASADRNSWSRSNRWVHRQVLDQMLFWQAQQGQNTQAPDRLQSATRPIVEFRSGLQLFDHGTNNLAVLDVLDTVSADALSTVNGRPVTDTAGITLDGRQLVPGDLVLFAADTSASVRQTVYRVDYVDVDGDVQQFARDSVQVATTGPVDLATVNTVDTRALQPGDRVLVWKQIDAAQNGIYVYDSVAGLQRAADANQDADFGAEFLVFVQQGSSWINRWFRYVHTDPGQQPVLGSTALTFVVTDLQGAVLALSAVAQASDQQCVVSVTGDQNRGISWRWHQQQQQWLPSSQRKTQVNQPPVFDVFDAEGQSFADESVYPASSFTGSALFGYQLRPGAAPDPVLRMPVSYRNLENIGDLLFDNFYEQQQFSYQLDPVLGTLRTLSINTGLARRHSALSSRSSELYSAWTPVQDNLELFQVISAPGQRQIQVQARLLNKPTARCHKVYVQGQQLNLQQYTVQQLVDQVQVTISDSVPVNSDTQVLVRLLTQDRIEGAWYDVPSTYELNPFNQRPVEFSLGDLKQHTDAVYSNLGSDQDNIRRLHEFQCRPGLIVLNESFSVLPTLLLTDPELDVEQALQTAAADYELFKLRVLQQLDQVEGAETLDARQALDLVMQQLTSTVTAQQPWYTSDMVPWSGDETLVVIDNNRQREFDLDSAFATGAHNQAVLLYLNNQQLIRGRDYELPADAPVVRLLRPVSVGDQLLIVQVRNTDGSGVPATPAKLGLAASWQPSMYVDDTYAEPVLVIQGHDGSITRARNDYRDAVLLELEQRIYNNIKVDTEFWNQVILSRVPAAGKFREASQLAVYSMAEQATVQRRLFYEWVAQNRVNYTQSVFDADQDFSYNYSGSTDVLGSSFTLGYWRGIYRDFFDTDRPHTHPWEMLGLTQKPVWWESTYGPAPYTGANQVLWQDLEAGFIRGTGEYSVLGARRTQVVTSAGADPITLSSICPVNASGQLQPPSDFIIADLNTQVARTGFTFNDGGPAETAWRRSSSWAFAQLRSQILQNPQFMLGTLWDLDNYVPQRSFRSEPLGQARAYSQFRYQGTEIPALSQVQFHSVDTDDSGSLVRRHSILNYVVEMLRHQGQDPAELPRRMRSAQVQLVYNLAAFADADNISVFAEQSSPRSLSQTVKVPAEDYSLLLANNVPVGQINYSGVIVSVTPRGYQVTGFDRAFPYFVIQPSISTGARTVVQVGSQQYDVYQQFAQVPRFIPYGFEFTTRQAVVDFLISYGEHLRQQGFVFEDQPDLERTDWVSAAIQFVKWSNFRWTGSNSSNRVNLVLNPGAAVLKVQPSIGTLGNLLANTSLVLDDNQRRIGAQTLDVFRDADFTYVNQLEDQGVIAALRARLVSFEHKLLLKNQTVFQDLVYNPVVGTRLHRVRLQGLKTGDWNGSLASAGFLLTSAQVPEWQPSTDYNRGAVVRYKNQNYVALTASPGSKQFPEQQFSLSNADFRDQLVPSLGGKALDLERAYDLPYQNSMSDLVRLRCATVGYVERSWLANLGLDLIAQTEFYRGWIKQKGSVQSLDRFQNAGTAELLADFQLAEEFAIKLGEWGATGRTGAVQVNLQNPQLMSNPLAVEFGSGSSDVRVLRVNQNQLRSRPSHWRDDFIQPAGALLREEQPFITAGPVLEQDITDQARAVLPDFNQQLQQALMFQDWDQLQQYPDVDALMKNIRAGSWIWLAIDDLLQTSNKYNVISWKPSSALVLSVQTQPAAGVVTLLLNQPLPVLVGDRVAVSVPLPQGLWQGVYTVLSNRNINQPQGQTQLQLSLAAAPAVLADAEDLGPGVAGLYVYQSLRHSTLASGNLTAELNSSGLPKITRAYVDSSNTGAAVYDLRQPWTDRVFAIPAAQQSDTATTALALDEPLGLIWLGRSAGNQVQLVQHWGFDFAQDPVQQWPAVLSSFVISTSAAPGATEFGSQLCALSSGRVAARFISAGGSGALAILQQVGNSVQLRQVLAVHTETAFAQQCDASADGRWLVVSAPQSSGTASVYVYEQLTQDTENLEDWTDTGDGTTSTFTLPWEPASAAAVQVLVDGEMLVADLHYTVSGTSLELNTAPADQSVLLVRALNLYYQQRQQLTDPAAESAADWAHSISISADGTVLAVGAPNSSAGRVSVYAQNISRSLVTTQGVQQVQTVVDSNNVYSLAQQLLGEPDDRAFGYSVAVAGDLLAVSAPRTPVRTGAQLIDNQGRVQLYALSSAVQASQTTLLSDLTLGTQSISIGGWPVPSASTAAELLENINNISVFTGVTAALLNNTAVQLNFDSNLHTTGVQVTGTSDLQALRSVWLPQQSVPNPRKLSRNWGQLLRWITADHLLISDDFREFVDDQLVQFDETTAFDGTRSSLFSAEPATGQRISCMQLLRTARASIAAAADQLQLTPVRTVLRTDAAGVQLVLAGNLNRLLLANRLASTETQIQAGSGQLLGLNTQVYVNQSLRPGWSLTRGSDVQLEPRSIRRAWIYKPSTAEKLLDLDLVDLAQGLLPGALAQQLDYVTSQDPASYGVALWQAARRYAEQDRVVWSGSVYQALVPHSNLYFSADQWQLVSTDASTYNTGSVRWGAAQLGQLWFNTQRVRVQQYAQGTTEQRLTAFNRWFPGTVISICEWVSSEQPPSSWTGTGTVLAPDRAVFDNTTQRWYFWVQNRQEPGALHNISAAELSAALSSVPESGLPLISAADSNTVILYNVTSLVNSADNVLHIDYVNQEHNNRLHSEYLLLSDDAAGAWQRTSIYPKLVDSLAGVDEQGLEVPDVQLRPEDRYGVLLRPRQSMFRNRAQALKIYFETLNQLLAQRPISNWPALQRLRVRSAVPTDWQFSVPDRHTLQVLPASEYAAGTLVLVQQDTGGTGGWSLVQAQPQGWQLVTSEFLNLSDFWQLADWSSADYQEQDTSVTLAHAGYLPSVQLQPGLQLRILDAGAGRSAVYQVSNNLELVPVFLQQATVQFLPRLYDFAATGQGWDASGFDLSLGFDSDPALALRLILQALHEHVLVGELADLADQAFFAMLRYVLQEDRSPDWLFRTSFVRVLHRVKDLNQQNNYRRDDEQFVEDFVQETKPFHTRIRSFTRAYTSSEQAGVGVTDFDVPALYDADWLQAQFAAQPSRPNSVRARAFRSGVALSQDADQQLLYVSSSGLARHAMGLWPNSTATAPEPQRWRFAITETPRSAAQPLPVLTDAPVGVAINGVPLFGYQSVLQDTLVWRQDPSVQETHPVDVVTSAGSQGPDAAGGYLTSTGAYVYRVLPTLLIPDTAGAGHSALLGFALDGYPIYGPWGYANADGSGGIVLNTSSYKLRTDVRLGRASFSSDPALGIVNGTALAEFTVPTGEYVDDWEYVPGLGTLDQHNGRFVVTPEFPFGTYAYFATVKPENPSEPAFPYLIGPSFHGVPSTLSYAYVAGRLTAVYENGAVQVPVPVTPAAEPASALRSPTGTFDTDAQRWQQAAYVDWNQNRNFQVLSVDLTDAGQGYTAEPSVLIQGGGGTGAQARAIWNPETQQLAAISLINPGTGYTSQPEVIIEGGITLLTWSPTVSWSSGDRVTWAGSVYQAVQDQPALSLDPAYVWSPVLSYAAADVVFNPGNNQFYQALDNYSGVEYWDQNLSYAAGTVVIWDQPSVQSYYVSTRTVPAGTTLDAYDAQADEFFWRNISLTQASVLLLGSSTWQQLGAEFFAVAALSDTNNWLLLDPADPAAQVRSARAVARMINTTTRSTDTAVYFDRGAVQPWQSATAVTAGSRRSYNSAVYQAQRNISAASVLTPDQPLSGWSLLYQLPQQQFTGVLVTGSEFVDTHLVPTGSLSDQDDAAVDQVALQLQFSADRAFDSVFNNQNKVAGVRSISTAPASNQLLVQQGSAQAETAFLLPEPAPDRYVTASTCAGVATGTADFTLEFFFQPRAANRLQALLDTRESDASTDGLLLLLSADNRVALSLTDVSAAVAATRPVELNLWHHLVVQRTADQLQVFLNGEPQQQLALSSVDHQFSSEALTLGAVTQNQDADLVAQALFDELRITQGLARYDFDQAFVLSPGAFARTQSEDANLPQVSVLMGFDPVAAEPAEQFSALVNSTTVRQLNYVPGSVSALRISYADSTGNISSTAAGISSVTLQGSELSVTRSSTGENQVQVLVQHVPGENEISSNFIRLQYLGSQLVLQDISTASQVLLVQWPQSTFSAAQNTTSTHTLLTVPPDIGDLQLRYFSAGSEISASDAGVTEVLISADQLQLVRDNTGPASITVEVTYTVLQLGAQLISSADALAANSNRTEIAALGLPSTGATRLQSLPDSVFSVGTQDFTLEFWCRPSADSGVGTVFTVADNFATSGSVLNTSALSISVQTLNDQHRVLLDVFDAQHTLAQLATDYVSAPVLYVTVQRYQQRLLVFVNGSLAAELEQADFSIGDTAAVSTVRLGDASSGFQGLLADLRFTVGLARYVPDTDPDTEISSEFSQTDLGTGAVDVLVDGAAFVNSVHSGTEPELVPGRMTDCLHIRVHRANSTTDPTEFSSWRQLLDSQGNLYFHLISSNASAELAAPLLWHHTQARLTSLVGFSQPDPAKNQLGVMFVGSERIYYTGVDAHTLSVTGLVRGTAGTSVPLMHAAGVRVEAANSQQQLPGTAGVLSATRWCTGVSGTQLLLDSTAGLRPGMTVQSSASGVLIDQVISSTELLLTAELSAEFATGAEQPVAFGATNWQLSQPWATQVSNNLDAAEAWWTLSADNSEFLQQVLSEPGFSS